jgi:hypothetical protein
LSWEVSSEGGVGEQKADGYMRADCKNLSLLLKSMVVLLGDRVEQINYYCSLKCNLLGEKGSNKNLCSSFDEDNLLCQDISRHV